MCSQTIANSPYIHLLMPHAEELRTMHLLALHYLLLLYYSVVQLLCTVPVHLMSMCSLALMLTCSLRHWVRGALEPNTITGTARQQSSVGQVLKKLLQRHKVSWMCAASPCTCTQAPGPDFVE